MDTFNGSVLRVTYSRATYDITADNKTLSCESSLIPSTDGCTPTTKQASLAMKTWLLHSI